MTYGNKENLKQILRLVLSILIGIAIGMYISKPVLLECTDYTLNQYEAGDVPVKCIDQFINNPEPLTKEL